MDSPITRQRKLSHEVARRIRDAILTGELKPGTRIIQDEWATRLGVSRMPVRDAVSSLALEGLVVGLPTNETVVGSLSEEDVRDAYLLNSLVTGIAAERTAQRITDETLNRLQDIHQRQVDATAVDDVEAAERHNWTFHRELNRACGSPRLIVFMRVLSAGIPHFAIRDIPSWRRQALKDHSRLLDALRSRDGRRARALMEDHVLTISELVINQLRERGVWQHGGKSRTESNIDGAGSADGASPD